MFSFDIESMFKFNVIMCKLLGLNSGLEKATSILSSWFYCLFVGSTHPSTAGDREIEPLLTESSWNRGDFHDVSTDADSAGGCCHMCSYWTCLSTSKEAEAIVVICNCTPGYCECPKDSSQNTMPKRTDYKTITDTNTHAPVIINGSPMEPPCGSFQDEVTFSWRYSTWYWCCMLIGTLMNIPFVHEAVL